LIFQNNYAYKVLRPNGNPYSRRRLNRLSVIQNPATLKAFAALELHIGQRKNPTKSRKPVIIRNFAVALAVAYVVSCGFAFAETFTPQAHSQALERIAGLVEKNYVYKNVAKRTAATLRDWKNDHCRSAKKGTSLSQIWRANLRSTEVPIYSCGISKHLPQTSPPTRAAILPWQTAITQARTENTVRHP
jgi:hypothetical protein